jgi:hypothetical protein
VSLFDAALRIDSEQEQYCVRTCGPEIIQHLLTTAETASALDLEAFKIARAELSKCVLLHFPVACARVSPIRRDCAGTSATTCRLEAA